MLQRRFREQERGGEDDDDENDKAGKNKKKGGKKGGDLRIHDLEEDLEMSSDDSDSSMGDGKKKRLWISVSFKSAKFAFPLSPWDFSLLPPPHLFIGQMEKRRQREKRTRGKEKQRRRRRKRAATKRPWRTAMTVTTRV